MSIERYPHASHSTVQKIMNEQLRFKDLTKAVKYITFFLQQYSRVKVPEIERDASDQWVTWIFGYEVNDNEKAEGYFGNFARILLEKDNDSHVFSLTKVPVELSRHPKVDPKSYTPDKKNEPGLAPAASKSNTRDFPFLSHPTLQKILKKELCFTDREKAIKYFGYFAGQFPKLKYHSDDLQTDNWTIWIHNFDLTDDEKAQGYLGNFGRISLQANEDNQFVFRLDKERIDLAQHPKARDPQHPINLSSDGTEKQRRRFDVRMEEFEKILYGYYLGMNYEAARNVLARLESSFVTSSLSHDYDENVTIFWVRGFGITPNELMLGYKGNFCKIIIYPIGEDSYGIRAEKILVEIKVHPERNREIGVHPDNGEWLIREINKQKRYDQVSEAENLISRLVNKYPRACRVISKNEVIVNVYSIGFKNSEGIPLKSFHLKIGSDENGFFLDFTEREKEFLEVVKGLDKGFYSTFFLDLVSGDFLLEAKDL